MRKLSNKKEFIIRISGGFTHFLYRFGFDHRPMDPCKLWKDWPNYRTTKDAKYSTDLNEVNCPNCREVILAIAEKKKYKPGTRVLCFRDKEPGKILCWIRYYKWYQVLLDSGRVEGIHPDNMILEKKHVRQRRSA